MFTGIVTDVGRVRAVTATGDTRFEIETAYDVARIELGASISCAGVCLTVVAKEPGCFAVDASAETLACSNAGDWREGTRLNLERALKVGDELGGHIVTGHVDGVAAIVERRPEGDSIRLAFELPANLADFVAPKGSVAINGASLTVNEVDERRFGVNLIPHTLSMTTFGEAKVGERVNIEIDVLARYMARMLRKEAP
ncbi:MAG: riboflavin synthase [Alphaproteobacteria bacterium]